jgi:hypothetical protein
MGLCIRLVVEHDHYTILAPCQHDVLLGWMKLELSDPAAGVEQSPSVT